MKRVFPFRSITLVGALALAALVPFSCDDNPSESDSSKLNVAVYSGNNQTERVGAMLPAPLVVRVSDMLGKAKRGVTVEFSSEPFQYVTPRYAATDAAGLASCRFQLGTRVGIQRVWAAIAEDSTIFSANAVALSCDEENPDKICVWPMKHLFIATTSSSLLGGAGSVVIDFDPESGDITEVLETPDRIDGISFSSRGELFASTAAMIGKIDTGATHDFESYIDIGAPAYSTALEPNEGGVLAGLSFAGPLRIGCPASAIQVIGSSGAFINVLWENLAVDPVTRDVYLITGSNPPSFVLWRVSWDGRSADAAGVETVANITVGAAAPRGMCADSAGTIYICFDGNDNWRRIVSVDANGSIDYDFFNFYTYYGSNSQEAGRWGDIAYLGGKLFVIDRRNDRLVVVSKAGTWLAEFKNTAFSRPLDESDHYAICPSPTWMCLGN